MPNFEVFWCALALETLLLGCVSTGAGVSTPNPSDPTVYVPLISPVSEERSKVIAVGVSLGSSSAVVRNGTLDRRADLLVLGSLSGSLSADHQSIVLDAGGELSIKNGGLRYVAEYISESASQGGAEFGILGVPSALPYLPRGGSARYSGTSTVQIIDGRGVFDLSGNSSASLDFDSRSVNVEFFNLDGSLSNGLTLPVNVSDVVEVSITGASLSGGRIEGGVFSLIDSQLSSSLSGEQTFDFNGAVFGPVGQEIGGSFIMDDSSGAGSMLIVGTFVGGR